MKTLLTTGKIAADTGAHRDQVCYAIRRLRIKPVGVAGPANIYPATTTKKVKQYLECDHRRRESAKCIA